MVKRDDESKSVNRIALFMTVAGVMLVVVLMFCFFCLVESFSLLFTHGTFTLVLPAIATAITVLAFMALAIVGGGAR